MELDGIIADDAQQVSKKQKINDEDGAKNGVVVNNYYITNKYYDDSRENASKEN